VISWPHTTKVSLCLGDMASWRFSSRGKVMKSLLVGTGHYLCKVYNYHDSRACGYKWSGILFRLDGYWMGLVLVRVWNFVLTFVFCLTIILVFCWTIVVVFYLTITFVFCWTIILVFCWTIVVVFCWTKPFVFGGTITFVGQYPMWTYFTYLGYGVVQPKIFT
jgi:hypothetical protein